MRRRLPLMVATVVLLTGCDGADRPSASAPPAAAPGCAPVAGEALIVLADDKRLQNADNVVPAINKKASSPEMIAALDRVSAALDTATLIELNKAVDIDGTSSKVAAEKFLTDNELTAGLAEGPGGDLVVGVADFAESATLGEIYRQVLTAAGYRAVVRQLGSREKYEPALESGEVDVVPEYAAALATYLAGAEAGADPSSPDLDATMARLRELGDEAGLVFGEPSAAQNQNAFAATRAFSEKYGVRTLSDLAARCSGAETVLGGPQECPQRPKCQQGLVVTYGFQAGKFTTLDPGGPMTKKALRQGTISVGLVFSSDGALAA